MTTIETIIKEFDEKFVRDDGLMNKYSWEEMEFDETNEIDTATAIKRFIIRTLKQVEQETYEDALGCLLEKAKTHGGEVNFCDACFIVSDFNKAIEQKISTLNNELKI